MTKIEEIQKKIKDLETAKFLLNMKDHWNNEDYERDRKYSRDIRELKKILEDMMG